MCRSKNKHRKPKCITTRWRERCDAGREILVTAVHTLACAWPASVRGRPRCSGDPCINSRMATVAYCPGRKDSSTISPVLTSSVVVASQLSSNMPWGSSERPLMWSRADTTNRLQGFYVAHSSSTGKQAASPQHADTCLRGMTALLPKKQTGGNRCLGAPVHRAFLLEDERDTCIDRPGQAKRCQRRECHVAPQGEQLGLLAS